MGSEQLAKAVKDGLHILKHSAADDFGHVVEGFASLVSDVGILSMAHKSHRPHFGLLRRMKKQMGSAECSCKSPKS